MSLVAIIFVASLIATLISYVIYESNETPRAVKTIFSTLYSIAFPLSLIAILYAFFEDKLSSLDKKSLEEASPTILSLEKAIAELSELGSQFEFGGKAQIITLLLLMFLYYVAYLRDWKIIYPIIGKFGGLTKKLGVGLMILSIISSLTLFGEGAKEGVAERKFKLVTQKQNIERGYREAAEKINAISIYSLQGMSKLEMPNPDYFIMESERIKNVNPLKAVRVLSSIESPAVPKIKPKDLSNTLSNKGSNFKNFSILGIWEEKGLGQDFVFSDNVKYGPWDISRRSGNFKKTTLFDVDYENKSNLSEIKLEIINNEIKSIEKKDYFNRMVSALNPSDISVISKASSSGTLGASVGSLIESFGEYGEAKLLYILLNTLLGDSVSEVAGTKLQKLLVEKRNSAIQRAIRKDVSVWGEIRRWLHDEIKNRSLNLSEEKFKHAEKALNDWKKEQERIAARIIFFNTVNDVQRVWDLEFLKYINRNHDMAALWSFAIISNSDRVKFPDSIFLKEIGHQYENEQRALGLYPSAKRIQSVARSKFHSSKFEDLLKPYAGYRAYALAIEPFNTETHMKYVRSFDFMRAVTRICPVE